MTTSTAAQVISAEVCLSASDAHQVAAISYRQCDHWARRGWVRPSVDPGEGRSGRRLYSADDVVRLDLLRHLAEAKVNTAVAGPVVGSFAVPNGDVRIMWGPLGSDPRLEVVPASGALEHLEAGGGWVVYNPSRVRDRIGFITGQVPVEGDAANTAGGSEVVVSGRANKRSA